MLLAAPRSEKIGEHGRRKRRHVDDVTRMFAVLNPPHPSSIWPEHSMLQATWREHEELRDRPRVRVTANGIGSALPDVSFIFAIVFNFCVDTVSAHPKQACQTLTTQTMRSWKAVAKANGEHSKRTHLGATCFEHVYVFFCVFNFGTQTVRAREGLLSSTLGKHLDCLAFYLLSKLLRSISVTIDPLPCHQRHRVWHRWCHRM